MKYEFHPIWGRLKGKLSTTSEQASELFGFKMKPKAKGIYFRTHKGIPQICNLVHPSNPNSPAQRKHREEFTTISRIETQIRILTTQIWNKISKKRAITGRNAFISRNLLLVGKFCDWSKLQLTSGLLPTPKVSSVHRFYRKIVIDFESCTTAQFIGTAILNLRDLKFSYLGEMTYKESLTISQKGHFPDDFFLYIYAKFNNDFSNTISFLLKTEAKYYLKNRGDT